MAPHEQDAQREEALLRLADAYVRGAVPLETLLTEHPDLADDLMEFVLLHIATSDAPPISPLPAAQRSPAAEKALAAIAASVAASQVQPPASLIEAAMQRGIAPNDLAARLNLTPDLLGKLQARAIAAQSIPTTVLRNLADLLGTATEAIARYFQGGGPTPASAFYLADRPPEQKQESFIEAVHGSPLLSASQKATWEEIVQRELPAS